MKYDDLKELGDSDLRYNITHFSEHDGICTMNGMIPIPVDAVSFSYEGDEDIEIYDEKGNYLGVLCICKAISDININSIQQGTGNREQGTEVKVLWRKAFTLTFVPHIPEICCN